MIHITSQIYNIYFILAASVVTTDVGTPLQVKWVLMLLFYYITVF
jgi:hypothetical protein